MATMTPTINSYNAYNMTDNVSNSKSGWHTWGGAVMGYASRWDAMAYKFTTGAFSGSLWYTITKLNVSLYYQRTGTGAGNFLFYILSYDPTGYSLDAIKSNNSAWGSYAFTSDSSWHTTNCSVSCNTTLSSNTTYYLVVCCDAGGTQKVSAGGFGLSFEYNYANAVSKPSAPAAPQDNWNNTFSASCDAVGDPGNNPVTTTIQYYLDGSTFDTSSRVISGKAHTALPAADTQTVRVRVKAQPYYGSDANGDGYADPVFSDWSPSTAIKNYVPPALPTVAPSISKSKTRFTVKEPWVVSWTGPGQTSTKVNNSSPVAGYRVVLRVKKAGESAFASVPIKNIDGTIISKNPEKPTWHTIDTIDLGGNSITIYPDKQGFEPGDQVQVGIRPYILWGAKNPTHYDSSSSANKLFKSGEDPKYKYTATATVQNAGVVRVKTGTDKSSFKEGIVWVKVNNTGTKTTDWVEADVVKVKTSSGWKESE